MKRRVLIERFEFRVAPEMLEVYSADKVRETGRLLTFKRAKVGESRKINRNQRRYKKARYEQQSQVMNSRIVEQGPTPGEDGHPGMFERQAWRNQAVG